MTALTILTLLATLMLALALLAQRGRFPAGGITGTWGVGKNGVMSHQRGCYCWLRH
ncbi:MAG: hypothetical protein QOH50_5010 [Kribbellaceae bacterium]|jgi:hypothetical protein|nr:hypothetical protein [Kribbellaceae bacterium]